MNAWIDAELERCRVDYDQVKGRRPSSFFCPILFRDEETEFCRAHLVNKAFAKTDRTCTVQRKDVDNFFGCMFEGDFVDLRHFGSLNALQMIGDKSASKRFNAKVLLNDVLVPHFFGPVSQESGHTSVVIPESDAMMPLGLKMSPLSVSAALDERWEVEVSRDLRLPMLVSTLKAAHLTLFKMLGYRYALSATGRYMGWDVLGTFYEACKCLPKSQVIDAAEEHFSEFVHMVRPLVSNNFDCSGTVRDGYILMCMGSSGIPWATVVFVKTEGLIHSVMVPSLQGPDQAYAFYSFLRNENQSLRMHLARFAEDKWEVSPKGHALTWSKEARLTG